MRGRRRCSGQSDNLNEEDFERDTEEENRSKKCPIGGAFLDRDANAAANIVQKLFLLASSNAAIADQTSTALLANLTRGVQVKQTRIFWLNSYVYDKNYHAVQRDKGVRITAC